MNVFKEKSVLIEEVWFDEEPQEKPNVDVVHYVERTQPINGIRFDEFYTRVLDITKDQESLWNNLGKNNRYKINRALQKDKFVYLWWNKETIENNILNEFFEFHDRFASLQRLKKISRSRVRSFAEAEILDLSLTKSPDGNPLVWHAHCCVQNRVVFFYGASLKNPNDTSYQSLVGRANRYHHWQDILRFKDLGISIYDFGGWYVGKTDQKLLNINNFKEEFGGEVVKSFKCHHGITWKGKLCVELYKILMR